MSIYTVENFTSDITVEGYIAEFRDEPHFLELCKQCTNYGKSWGCPPFDFDTESFLRQYKYAHLMATKIIPEDKDIPIEYTQKLILPERIRIESELLDMERKYGKRLLNYILCIRFFIEVHSIVSASRFFHMPTYLRVVIECQSRFFPFFPAFSRNCPDYFLHTSGSSSFRSLSDLGAR